MDYQRKSNSVFVTSLVTLSIMNLSSCSNVQNHNYPKRAVANQTIWPKITGPIALDPKMESEIVSIVSQMTLEEKIGQMTQPEIKNVTPAEITTYRLGSVLNGGGSWPQMNKKATVSDWVNYATLLHNASMDNSAGGQAIPLIWGIDAVHGNNNVIGATLFPHNIGLGATHNPQLIRKIAKYTAEEVAVTGLDWAFAPTLAVVRDDRWGRTYEGYSEDPELVKAYASEMIEGLQGTPNTKDFLTSSHVIATAKHFIGDGGTFQGINEGDNRASEQELFDLHAQGYIQAIKAGTQTIMASYNSWHGDKMHGQGYLLTDVLKNQMGFDGFIISDWNGIGQVRGCTNDHCPQAINAGVDMVMVPDDWKKFIKNTIDDVKSGVILESRINDAVTRILRVKMRAGLFVKITPDQRKLANKKELLGSSEHRMIARQAVRESLVLLKNKKNILPLDRNLNVLVVGDTANNFPKQTGGWSITWQGDNTDNSDFPGATSILKGIQDVVTSAEGKVTHSLDGNFQGKYDVAIFVYGENPYAETKGDLKNLEYQFESKTDLKILKDLKAKGIPVVSVFLSGRPLVVNKELNASNAFVAAWLPGSEGAGIADVLFKNKSGKIGYDFLGKLSYSWPKSKDQTSLNRFDKNYNPLFPYGFGLTYKDQDTLDDHLAEE